MAGNASSKFETQSRTNEVRLLSASRSRVTTKSSSSSSTRRMRTARCSRSDKAVWGKLDDLDPVTADVAHDGHESVETDWFCDEGVSAEVIGPVDVLFGFRRGEHDDRNAAEIGIGLDLAQRFASVFARHVEIEQDQAGCRRG